MSERASSPRLRSAWIVLAMVGALACRGGEEGETSSDPVDEDPPPMATQSPVCELRPAPGFSPAAALALASHDPVVGRDYFAEATRASATLDQHAPGVWLAPGSGEILLTELDLGVAADGVHLGLRRTWDDRVLGGAFGRGWRHDLGPDAPSCGATARCDERGHVLEVVQDGERLQVAWEGSRPVQVQRQGIALLSFSYDAEGRIIRATARDGGTVTYRYDAKDRLVGVDGPDGTIEYRYQGAWLSGRTTPDGAMTVTWDDRWRATALVGPGQRHTTAEYEDMQYGHLVTVRDAAGAERTYDFDPLQHRIDVTDHAGKISRTFDGAGRLRTVVDRDGGAHAFMWNADGHLLTATHPGELTRTFSYEGDRLVALKAGSHELRWSYDAQGWLASFTDRLGRQARWTRDTCGRVTGIQRPEGTRLELAYDAQGRLASITDQEGRVERRHHDERGRLVRVETATGHTVEMVHDDSGRIVERREDGAATDRWTHDPRGRIRTHTDASGRVTTLTYDAQGRLTVADRDGAQARLRHDALDRLVDLDTPMEQLAFTWDPAGRVASVASRERGRTVIEQDGHGRATRLLQGGRPSTEARRDDAGRLIETVDESGRRAVFEYDELGQLESRRSADEVASYERLANGQVRESGLLSGTMTLWAPTGWDGALRPTRASDEHGEVRWRYDAHGRLIEMLRAGERVNWRLDARGLPRAVTSNRSGELEFEQDASGRVVRIRQGKSWQRAYTYDTVGLLLEVREGDSFRKFEYDARGRLVRVLDPLGHQTRIERTLDGRMTTVTDPAGRQSSTRRDPVGRIIESARPGGQRDRFQYDRSGRLARWVAGTAIVGRFEYDDQGRPLRIELGSSHTKLGRDEDGRLVSRSDLPGATVGIRHDAAGRVTGRASSSGARLTLTRDESGRVTRVGTQQTGIELGRGTDGRVEQMRCADATVRYRHDATGRIAGWYVEDAGGKQALAADFAYDPTGRLEQVKVGDATRTYGYDEHRRLVSVMGDGAEVRYQYDAAGELVAAGDAKLPRDPGGAPEAGPGGRVELDADGRVVRLPRADGELELRYDAIGRLSEVRREGAALARYTYGPAGELTSRTGPTGTTRWLLDESGKPLQQTSTATGREGTRTYLRPGGEHSAPLGFLDGGELYCLLTDPADSVVAVVDDEGRIVNRYTHGGYAEPELAREQIPLAFRFHGRYVDPDTGLLHLGHRWYSPELRSFLQPDPLPATLATLESHPRYAFLAADPVNHHDPLGTEVYEWQQGVTNLMEVCNQFQAGKVPWSYGFGKLLDGFKAVGAIEDSAGNMFDVWVKRVPGSDAVKTVFRNLNYKSGGPYGKPNISGNIILAEQPSTAPVAKQAVESSTSTSSRFMERLGDAYRAAKHGVQLFTRQISSTVSSLGGTWGTLTTALPTLMALPGGTTIVAVGAGGSGLIGYGIGTVANEIPAVENAATKVMAKAQGTDVPQFVVDEQHCKDYLGERSRELEKQKIAKAIEEGKVSDIMPPTPDVAGGTPDLAPDAAVKPPTDAAINPIEPVKPVEPTPAPTADENSDRDDDGSADAAEPQGPVQPDADAEEDEDANDDTDQDADSDADSDADADDDDAQDEGGEDEDGEIPSAFRDYPFHQVSVAIKFDDDHSFKEYKNIVTCKGSLSFWNVGTDVPGKGGAVMSLTCTSGLSGAKSQVKRTGTFTGGPGGKFRFPDPSGDLVFYLKGGKSVTIPDAGTFKVKDSSVFDDYPG